MLIGGAGYFPASLGVRMLKSWVDGIVFKIVVKSLIELFTPSPTLSKVENLENIISAPQILEQNRRMSS